MANLTATYQQLLGPGSAATTPVAAALGTLARHPAVESCRERYALGTSLTLVLWQAYFAGQEALGDRGRCRGPPRSAAMLRAAAAAAARAARDWALHWLRLSALLAVLLPGLLAWAPFALAFVACHEAVGMLCHSYHRYRGLRRRLGGGGRGGDDANDDGKKD